MNATANQLRTNIFPYYLRVCNADKGGRYDVEIGGQSEGIAVVSCLSFQRIIGDWLLNRIITSRSHNTWKRYKDGNYFRGIVLRDSNR